MTVIADVLVLVGCVGLTLAVIGIVRLPDTESRVHAASKASFFGLMPILAASVLTLDAAGVALAAVIAFYLVFSPVVAGHAIGRAAWEDSQEVDRE